MSSSIPAVLLPHIRELFSGDLSSGHLGNFPVSQAYEMAVALQGKETAQGGGSLELLARGSTLDDGATVALLFELRQAADAEPQNYCAKIIIAAVHPRCSLLRQ